MKISWQIWFFSPQSFRILKNGCSTGHIIFTCPSIKMSWIWNDLKQLFKGHHGLTIKGHVGVFSVGLFGLKWRNWSKSSKTDWILCKGKCASIQNISTGRQSFSESYMLKFLATLFAANSNHLWYCCHQRPRERKLLFSFF